MTSINEYENYLAETLTDPLDIFCEGMSAAPPPKYVQPPGQIHKIENKKRSPQEWYTYLQLDKLEQEYKLKPTTLMHLIEKESNGDPFAMSHVGATGIVQLTPQSGFKGNPKDPVASLNHAAKMIRELLNKFNGSYEKALAAYNWGESNLRKYGIARAPKETRDYVNFFRKKGIVPPKIATKRMKKLDRYRTIR